MEVITETKLALKKDKKVAMISLDIRKYFDQIPRDRLKIKLQTIGVTGCLLNWTMTMFDDMRYAVRVANVTSEGCKHEIGIPQGSILSPILAAMYSADVPAYTESKSCETSRISTHQYADDNCCYITADTWDEVDKRINETFGAFYT